MEIKINSLSIKNDNLIAVMGDYNYFFDLFDSFSFSKNNILVDKKRLNKEDKRKLQKKIAVIPKMINSNFHNFTVFEYLKYQVIDSMLDIKNYHKKIEDSLKIVGLSKTYLSKRLVMLSYSEKKLVQLASYLIANPDIIVLDSFFEGLDSKITKDITSLFNQMVDRCSKFIIVCTNDSEFVYRRINNLIVVRDSKTIFNGKTNDFFEQESTEIKLSGIKVPEAIEFTNLVHHLKQVKLNYNRDIRDLIKDIYKKV